MSLDALTDNIGNDSIGNEWLVLLAVCFVGVLYWAFRPGRPRVKRDEGPDK